MNRRKKQREIPTRMQVLVSLFLWRGPFGLGSLWKSDAFQRREKLILTLAVCAYSVLLLVILYAAGRLLYARMVF